MTVQPQYVLDGGIPALSPIGIAWPAAAESLR